MIRAVWKTALASALWPVAFTVLANAPARYAMTLREHQFGYGIAAPLAVGVLADIACLAPLFASALAPSHWLAARRARNRRRADLTVAVAVLTIAAVSLGMWAVSVGATEFRIQRGTYPAMIEVREGLTDTAFLRGSAKIALFERYSWPTLVALLALGVTVVAFARHLPRSRGPESPPLLLRRHGVDEHAHLADRQSRSGFRVRPDGSSVRSTIGPVMGSIACAAIAAVLFFAVRAAAPGATSNAWVPPLVRLAADVASPDLRVLRSVAASRTAAAAAHGSIRSVLSTVDLGEPTVRNGLHWLGFGDAHARCLRQDDSATCVPHPLARPLPGDDSTSAVLPMGTEDPTPLVRAFLSLSAALFEERETPLTVWHVALESFRADDVHTLHPAAPPGLTPFVDAAYAVPEAGGPRALGFRHAFQSGLRTAQAVSGLWCGLGALPFQLALSRDLVDLNLRCMPDVLRDAGFDTRLYYGSNASFEHLGDFARLHGLAVTDLSTLPPGLPRGAFKAVTDAALLGVAERDSTDAPALAYRFILTLSGHSPFDVPDDVSTVTRNSGGNGILDRLPELAPEDRRRLVTMSYADQALAAFVRKIESSPQGARSLFVISADHATADPFLWGEPTIEAMSRVPLVVYLPARLVTAAKDPQRAERAIRDLDALAQKLPVSLNDVPTLLLALLARHPALKHLRDERRWHTLGGAASSPHFAARTMTTAQVWGIDASSRVFVVQSSAVDQLLDTREKSVAFSVWNEPLGPVLKDVSGALSAILRACSE